MDGQRVTRGGFEVPIALSYVAATASGDKPVVERISTT